MASKNRLMNRKTLKNNFGMVYFFHRYGTNSIALVIPAIVFNENAKVYKNGLFGGDLADDTINLPFNVLNKLLF